MLSGLRLDRTNKGTWVGSYTFRGKHSNKLVVSVSCQKKFYKIGPVVFWFFEVVPDIFTGNWTKKISNKKCKSFSKKDEREN